MKTIGSQTISTLEEEGLFLVNTRQDEIIVQTKDNKHELWRRNDDFAGFVLGLFGAKYEFVETL